jgi:hypothetical protein
LFHELTAGLDTIRFFPDPENSWYFIRRQTNPDTFL